MTMVEPNYRILSTRRLVTLILLLFLVVIGVIYFWNGNNFKASTKTISCGGSICNVVLIVNDTLSAKHMGLYGYSRDTTPFIDKFFSQNSIVFKNASSNSSWTLPSFASFFTSKYPSEIRFEMFTDKLDPKIKSFTDDLQKAGIKIAAFYARNIGYPNLEKLKWGIVERFKSNDRVAYSDNRAFVAALLWIDEHKSKPFFVMIHNKIVHDSYSPKDSYRKLFDAPENYLGDVTQDELRAAEKNFDSLSKEELERFRREYDQQVRYLDDSIKYFVNNLSEKEKERTVIILTADHGEGFGEHKKFLHANSLYEELLHVPLLMKIPGIKQKFVNEPISLLDLGPSIIDIFGLPKDLDFHGISLLRGEIPKRIIKAELAKGKEEFRPLKEFYSNIRREDLSKESQSKMVRYGKWKVIKKFNNSLEIYNLIDDPQEKTNLINNWKDFKLADQEEIHSLLKEVVK